jgi:ubiquinone biosynthesis accessory factor UbiJ
MLITSLENLLNRGLPRSPAARALCATLAGRQVSVEVQGLGEVLVQSDGVALRLSRAAGGAPAAAAAPDAGQPSGADARIIGGPFSLLSMAFTDPQAVIRRGAVQMQGDTAVAEQFHRLLQLLRPDPEEELALVLGDIPAHGIGRLLRAGVAWGQRAAGTTLENISEYLAHERGDLVSRGEASAFLADVDTLREDLDRLQARIALMHPPSS